MKKLFVLFLNLLFFTAVTGIAVVIAMYAYTNKISKTDNESIQGTVRKKNLIVFAGTKGIIRKIDVRTGQEIAKGDLLAELSPLEDKAATLSARKENTTKQAGKKNDNTFIRSPVNGVVSNIILNENMPVDEDTRLLSLYSNEDIQFSVDLTLDQYQKLTQSAETSAYSNRLNENYLIKFDTLNPEEHLDTSLTKPEKKIGILFSFVKDQDAKQLLNNEDLDLKINRKQPYGKVTGFIMDFWDSLISFRL